MAPVLISGWAKIHRAIFVLAVECLDVPTAEKMKGCVWVEPIVVARIAFAEWTGADKLRHTKFVALRDEQDPRKVVRET